MPRDGDTPLARFAHAIVDGNGFSFGPPKLSDDGATVALPVLRTVPGPRSYLLAAERVADISAVDPGRIDRLRVRNDSETTVFLPAGSIFDGRKTTSRGTIAGSMLAPANTLEIGVKCVQAARPVVGGETLSLAHEPAPLDLTQALVSGDQGLVWAAADAPGETVARGSGPSPMGRECGQILLDAGGVVAAEIYDHPESWAAAGLRRRPPSSANPLGLNPENAAGVARRFLRELASIAIRPAGPSAWEVVDRSATFTVLHGTVIHLVAFGRDLTPVPSAGPGEIIPTASYADSLEASEVSAASDGEAGSEAAAASRPLIDPLEASATRVTALPRRRKVLTSGWDSATFASLERFSHKEFRGDRSAAIRALVRRGLGDGGYLGPRILRPRASSGDQTPEELPAEVDETRVALEAKVRAYERIAETETYADWLRKRARLEAERLKGVRTAVEIDEPSPEPVLPDVPDRIEEVSESEVIEPEIPSALPPPPVDVRPLLRRAFAASAGGHYPEALTLFDDVLTAEPDNRTALLGRAVALRRSGKAQDALDALDAVLRAEPLNAAALLNRGRLLQERGDLEGALGAFDLLTTAAPNDWDVWLVRGDVLAKLGRRAEALHAYAEALRRNPDDESLQQRIKGLETLGPATAPPPTPQIPLPRDVGEGQSYLVREARPNLSLRVLRALGARGVPSLAITVRPPEALRRDIGIAGVRVLELSHTPGEGRADPTALASLSRQVERFIQEGHGHGVIAMDGLAQLVLENGSRETLLFVERVHEAVLQSRAVFLVSVAPGDISDREVALLERSLRSLA